MNNLLNKSLWALFALAMVSTSCSKEELIEQAIESNSDDIAIDTEVVVDGENVTNTRAASEAGWTTGDGRYHENDPVIVAAYANEGYELVRFYDKGGKLDQQDGSFYKFPASINQTFKAEFKTVSKYTITATAESGGTVSGGGIFKQGTNCTLTANSNSGYTFDGWYENGSKVSSSSTYTFTVSSNRTLTAKFSVLIQTNTINAWVEKYGGTGLKFTISSRYPISSPISISYAAKGYYSMGVDYPDGSQRWESYYFEGSSSSKVLNTGTSTWEIIYYPGIQTGGSIDEANWYIDFTEFSDSNYQYEKGNCTGYY